MQLSVLKFLLDIQSVIHEIENIKSKANNNFSLFQSDIILQRAVERDLEIIGEAIRKIIEIDPTIQISSVNHYFLLVRWNRHHSYSFRGCNL